MQLMRQIEDHGPNGIVVLPFREIETAPRLGDWKWAPDGKSKLVMNGQRIWEPWVEPTVEEFEVQMLNVRKLKLLGQAIGRCEFAMKSEHGTCILHIEAEGVAETERSIVLQEPTTKPNEMRQSILTADECRPVFESLCNVIKAKYDALKESLGVR